MQFLIPSYLDTHTQAEIGATVPILNAKTLQQAEINGIPVSICVRGYDSDAYQAAVLEINRERVKVQAADGEWDAKRAAARLLSHVTLSWTGFVAPDGREVSCTKEAAEELYYGVPWVRDQVDAFVSNRGNFIRASSES